MRYVITQGQLHRVVYKYLDNIFDGAEPLNIPNPYSDNTYRMELRSKKNKMNVTYYYYGPGTYDDDDDTKHNGVGELSIHADLIDTLRELISIRQTKVFDLISDWFSEKYNVDVDEVSIYPERKKPPVY
jgi:hypothetical protein